MGRGYSSRRMAELMQAPAPVQTPDTDAAKVYAMRWRRQDGTAVREIPVLALDEQMAQEMGGIRLREKYDESILDWSLVSCRQVERITSLIFAILEAEDPDEAQLRHDTFSAREEAEGASA
jgi:hypothetical protein